MELKLLPFTFPGGLPQGMTTYVNGRLLKHIPLVPGEWQSYTIHLANADLTGGINTFRFVYDYTASPSRVLPGNGDLRQLAVAFDYIRFRPER
jgi:hypothetical protein